MNILNFNVISHIIGTDIAVTTIEGVCTPPITMSTITCTTS